jgi:hypothetical protein
MVVVHGWGGGLHFSFAKSADWGPPNDAANSMCTFRENALLYLQDMDGIIVLLLYF